MGLSTNCFHVEYERVEPQIIFSLFRLGLQHIWLIFSKAGDMHIL